jgi:hypothetical protein
VPALVAGTLFGVAACAPGPARTAVSPAPTTPLSPAEAVDPDKMPMPLDGYSGSSEQNRTISNAALVLIARCMHSHGFTYRYTPLAGDRPRQRGYGFYDTSHAASAGYGPVGTPPPSPPADPTENTPAYRQALYGSTADEPPVPPPPGACIAADSALHPPGVDLNVVGRLAVEADGLTRDDPRVTNAVTAWRDCMRGRGFRYDTPWQVLTQPWPRPVQEAERATATADVECKRTTHLPETYLVVQRAYEVTLVAQNLPALMAARDAQAEAFRRARAVLAAKG